MIDDYYSETIIIMEKSTSTSTYWDTAATSYTSAQSIDAAVNQLDGKKRYVGDGLNVLADYKVYCDKDTAITIDKRYKWDGEIYEMVEAPKNTLQKDHHYKFLMRKLSD